MAAARMPAASSAKVGSGVRFDALQSALGRRKGVTSPGGLAGFIGRKKYGNARMAAMSAAGRKRAGAGGGRRADPDNDGD